MKKRILGLLMAAVMLCCAAPVQAEAPVEINWLGYYTSDLTISADTPVEKFLEEKFNVSINPITDISKSGFGLYVASTDILNATFYTIYLDNAKNLQEMYDQGLIREVPEEWLDEYYPTGMKYLKDFLGEDYFTSGNHLKNGKLLNIPYTKTENNSQSVIVYRKDWLEHLNLAVPTTLDEFHDMLYAFTYNDPDGNGVNDTYGMDASTAWVGMWMIYGSYGFAQHQSAKCGSFYKNEDGTVTYTSVTDAYQQALALIAQWYAEGILDPECITDSRADIRTKWSNGSIGAMVDSFTWTLSKRSSSSVIGMVEDIFGENTVGVLGKLACETGDGTVYASKNYPETNVNQSIVFTAGATDEQVIRTLQILEALSADDDAYKYIIFGENGVDYTVADDGQICVNPSVSVEYQAGKGLGDTFYGLAMCSPELTYCTYSTRDRENLAMTEESPVVYRNTNFSDVTNEAYLTYFEEVKKVEAEFYTDVLLGRKDVHDDWSGYVEKMNKAGLSRIIEEYEQLLAQ